VGSKVVAKIAIAKHPKKPEAMLNLNKSASVSIAKHFGTLLIVSIKASSFFKPSFSTIFNLLLHQTVESNQLNLIQTRQFRR
jgi:hypothetical protein